MFFITAIEHMDNGMDTVPKHNFVRCFGYYKKLSIAKTRVLQNASDLHETIYNYIVIEDIEINRIHPVADDVCWFKWQDNKWVECLKPANAYGKCNWALG